MKKIIFAFVIIALLSSSGYSQTILGEDTRAGLRFDAVSAPVKFSLGGTKSMALTPLLFGLAYDAKVFGLDVPLGLYSSIMVDSETTEAITIPIFLLVGVYKNLNVGLFYDFWQEGDGKGVQGLNENTFGFAANYNFSLTNPK